MSQIHIAIDAFSAIVVLFLLYANIFELKQHTRKRDVFTRLLLANEAVILLDLVSWFKLGWENKVPVFWTIITLTYVIPCYILAVFARYIYIHISDKGEIDRKPFLFIVSLSGAVCIISFFLCISGSMFEIKNGAYYPGKTENYYYLFYVLSLLFFSCVIIFYHKQLGVHDLFVALSFCILPVCSILLSMFEFSINFAIPFMAINMLVIFIMLQSEREKNLFLQSNIDELTGLYNRRSYEEDLIKYSEDPVKENFVYTSIDLNGLKQINDNLGHAAGDEIICGAADCLKRTLGKYGKVYRTGGDEFVSMIFICHDNFESIIDELEKLTENWKGKLVDSLTLSLGYASKKEFPEKTISEMSKISDEKMYEAKRRYYASKGVDRRGQAAAHTALCNLYTKILKINITNDTYHIVNMDKSEQTIEKGFADTISSWFTGFGKSGQVHNDDLNQYLEKTDLNFLKEYFNSGKTSISIFYRRKFPDGFKQAAMEMIPADDYSSDNQTLFLYVRNIDGNN